MNYRAFNLVRIFHQPSNISSSEWVAAMKMNANVAPVRGVPGRSQDGSRCRHCSEYETLPHVLGFCSKGYLLRIGRHNRIRSLIAENLRKTGFTVVEEMICNATNGSIRRFDILAMDVNKNIGWILDPHNTF